MRSSPCAAKPAMETNSSIKAIAAGAVAIVSDSAEETPREGVAWAQVPHGRRALARLSANFYKRPAERLAITGITGTNGKSTTAFLLEAILSAANRKSALIGTIEYHVAGKVLPAPHTTPEALDLNRILAEALGNGATEAVMEVSSHALAQQRVYGDSIRRGRVHQPDPRPPRLSSHHGRVFCGEADPVRRLRHRPAACCRAQCRRRVMVRNWRRSARNAVRQVLTYG